MDKKRRVIETLKTLLIVVLTCSAAWLVADSQLFGQLPGVLGRPGHSETGGHEQMNSSYLIRPARMAVMSAGGCCGVQYDSQELTELFERMAPLLNEAVSSAHDPQPVDRERWEQALLSAPGVYFDFQSGIPMQVLSGWLSGRENQELTAWVRHLLLSTGEDGQVLLYYRDESSGQYYACRAEVVNADYLSSAVSQTTANGAIFAFQSAVFEALGPDTLISVQAPEPREYVAENPLLADEEERLNALLEELLFPLGITTVYETPEGRRARSGNDTLTIANDGVITYHTTGQEQRYPITRTEGDSEVFCVAESVRQLVSGVLERWSGEGRIYLSYMEKRETDSWYLEFSYALDDTPVRVGPQGCAASVLVSGDRVTEFELQLRTYTPLEQRTLVLPQEQAAAALAGMDRAGSYLQLCYQDSGDTVQAGWIAD